jgi:hypothetical protein
VDNYKYQASLNSSPELNKAYASIPALTPEEDEVKIMICNLINSVNEMQALHDLKKRIDNRMVQDMEYKRSVEL